MLAIKRINKDIKEITKNPLEGIGIASIGEDLMRYVINMRLMNGPYEGYCLQLLLIFSDNYPTKPPKILIYPEQAIDHSYHHHIFNNDDRMRRDDFGDSNNEKLKYKDFKQFCFDISDNEFMPTNEAKSGWNPSYSISFLLLQVQNFISDPDMGGYVPNKNLIDQLFKSMDNYSRTFDVHTENGIIKKVHTWKDPYPEMYFAKKEGKGQEKPVEKDKDKDEEKLKEEIRIQQIKENLNCFMLKVNYIDDSNILLGYPIISSKKLGNKLFELYPIPELLTYEGFEAQKQLQGIMAEQYYDYNNNYQFKSANNEYYNSWLPIYINKDHYEKNKSTILKSIARIINNNHFNPEQIFQVLPAILNCMIISIQSGKSNLSSAFIKCYFQYILLFKKMCLEYDTDYSIYLNEIFSQIKENNYIVNKKIIPDIGNFFIVLLFNKVEISNETLKKIYNALFEDFIIRQMYWLFHGNETKDKMKNLLMYDYLNEKCFKDFETDPNFKMIGLAQFNNDLLKEGIFNEVVNIISKDKGFLEHLFIGKEKAKEQVEKRINQSFKRLFLECSKEGRNKLKELISKNLNFSSYFGSNNLDTSLYDTYQCEKLLKDVTKEKKIDILKLAFESQKGNQLLLITFFARKKVEEKGFLDELEKNYGVYLEVDNFIKDLNKKKEEIKSYKELFKYVGADFNKDKDDFDLIIESYTKAKEKNYIKAGNRSNNSSNMNSMMNVNINNQIFNQPPIMMPVPIFDNLNNNFNMNNPMPIMMNNNYLDRSRTSRISRGNRGNRGNIRYRDNNRRGRNRYRSRSRERRRNDSRSLSSSYSRSYSSSSD